MKREHKLTHSVEDTMALEQFQNSTAKQKNTSIITNDRNTVRNNPLYKGQLSYLKEIILSDCPDIDANLLSEKLDVTYMTAQVLLSDCHKKELQK